MKKRAFAIMVMGLAASIAATAQSDTPARAARATQSATSGAICDDITKLDLRNLTLQTGDRSFAFHNGVAKSGPLEQIPVGGQVESRRQWKAEIEQDTVVHPASDAVVRFLLINDSHETGSGWRYYLLGLRCTNGKLEKVFHREGLSLSVDRLDDTGVTVGLTDGDGAPTRKRWLYTWDGQRYVLASTQ